MLTGEFTIEGPDGEAVSLIDMEKVIADDGPLPERTRRAFRLAVVEDMSPEAVASDMGISVSTVTGLVHSALKTVAKNLG
jgi:DNA-directed RNA polymerase specialized sigma24 family protein